MKEDEQGLLEDWAQTMYPDLCTRPDDANRLLSEGGAILVKRKFDGDETLRHLKAYLWSDLFTSLVDAPWWRILLFGSILYLWLWIMFGLLYWVFNNESVYGCHKSMLETFADAFVLSIDSQSTIGFGNYAVDSDCAPGIFILVAQCLVSVIVDAAYTGLIFIKEMTAAHQIARPQHRSKTIVFSRNMCIAEGEDGVRRLMVRVADQRKNLLAQAHARLLMYYTDLYSAPQDGEGPQRVWVGVKQLKLVRSSVFLLLPEVLEHRIDATSPLFKIRHPDQLRGVMEVDYDRVDLTRPA